MRKLLDLPITPENCPTAIRDHGKTFHLTEMSAYAAEEWGVRATLALIPRLSREVPVEVAESLKENPSMSAVERVGALLGGISFPEMRDLARDLDACVQIIVDPRTGPRPLGLGGTEDIEEVETIRFLRSEVLKLHVGFTLAAVIFNLVAVASQTSPLTDVSTSPSP